MDKWIHYDYEDYVEANWDSGYNFKSIVENNNNYYTITDPEQATKDLAGYSNTYLDELYQTIYFNPDTWETMQISETLQRMYYLEQQSIT